MINGGAYCTLAETVGSMAANLCIDRSKKVALGLDINANHLKSVSQGFVYGKATPLHIGKTTQVWEIKITNEKNQLCCISRLTMAVVNLPES
jgi:1,4-dihydroxy-2-naphthoyl-CoA hydrolase